MKMNWKKNMLGYVAVAIAFLMIGCTITLSFNAKAEDTTKAATTVVTSPFTEAVQSVRSSVVGVSNYQTVRYSNGGYSFGWGYGSGNNGGSVTEQEVLSVTGSGVVIGTDIVLTNYHVVEGASSLKVTTGEESATDGIAATLLAYDENLDIAILQASGLGLPAVKLGDSDTLQVGDWAICIGNPLSDTFSGTVTAGIISGLDRSVSSTSTDKYGLRETTSNTMIQTDAAINSGNSGGGMFNTAGELMGIPTMKYSGSVYSTTTIEGIGMCIPINAAKPLIEDVLAGDVSVTTSDAATTDASAAADSTTKSALTGKPRMGVTIRDFSSSSTAVLSGKLPNGVYIQEVEEGTPAAEAGLEAGDIIVDVDDTVITSVSQLSSIIAEKSEGDTLTVKVYRVPGLAQITDVNDIPGGSYVTATITLKIVDAVSQ